MTLISMLMTTKRHSNPIISLGDTADNSCKPLIGMTSLKTLKRPNNFPEQSWWYDGIW